MGQGENPKYRVAKITCAGYRSISFFYGGGYYQETPNLYQKDMAEFLASLGGDIIIGVQIIMQVAHVLGVLFVRQV